MKYLFLLLPLLISACSNNGGTNPSGKYRVQDLNDSLDPEKERNSIMHFSGDTFRYVYTGVYFDETDQSWKNEQSVALGLWWLDKDSIEINSTQLYNEIEMDRILDYFAGEAFDSSGVLDVLQFEGRWKISKQEADNVLLENEDSRLLLHRK